MVRRKKLSLPSRPKKSRLSGRLRNSADKPGPKQPASQPLPTRQPVTASGFPIVGVGASAGGLEAFKQFLTALPTDTGMAFVLVQHLAPNHESMSADILSRVTRMPVVEVKNGMRAEPNHVYVIPPQLQYGHPAWSFGTPAPY